jgi:hypothetical protein
MKKSRGKMRREWPKHMIFDNTCRVVRDPDRAARLLWSQVVDHD